ncbi:MAG: hypothetical protein C0490_05505, partial [Marivirga sp.]|nr:hypothetical protein [Marivirga sp.]
MRITYFLGSTGRAGFYPIDMPSTLILSVRWFYLKSPQFDVIVDYLSKTGSSIIMPQMVLDEIAELYLIIITDKTVSFNNAVNELRAISS